MSVHQNVAVALSATAGSSSSRITREQVVEACTKALLRPGHNLVHVLTAISLHKPLPLSSVYSAAREPSSVVGHQTVNTVCDLANQSMSRGRPWHALQAPVFSMTQMQGIDDIPGGNRCGKAHIACLQDTPT
ncbi:hypothetical protein HGRIS_001380 [Hohenbuehelia grisea]|uniref:Uncharacterized protein n=1 Tax=Hohenbuehelia grisea TaxID=104357 RepID=A0ABR3JRB9_9AGAR